MSLGVGLDRYIKSQIHKGLKVCVYVNTHTIPHYKNVMLEWRYRSVISSFLAHSQEC